MKSESLDPRLSPRGKILLPLGLVLLVGLTVHRLFLADPPPAPVDLHGTTMGTTWSVRLDTEPLSSQERQRVQSAIQDRLDAVNGLMSTYDPDSELSRFNGMESTEPFSLSPATLRVLQVALSVSQASSGALDPTVGPLVEAWGFGAADLPPVAPAEADLAALLERVGYRGLTLDPDAGTLTRAHPGTQVDLSAVAKGFAVDAVAADLDALGYRRHLVEVGGELRAGEAKRSGEPWRVAVETPDAASRTVYGVVDLVSSGMATSGDYRNFYELDGVEYAHLIDPRTGRPVRHSGASVSVVHPSAAAADAWATGLSVLGVAEGLEVAEAEGLAALFIERDGDGYRSRATKAYRDRFGEPGLENREE